MNTSSTEPARNGRKAALWILAVALMASGTTVILALNAADKARVRDEAAASEDRRALDDVLAAKPGVPADGIRQHRLEQLEGWTPRTPCGDAARDRVRSLLKGSEGDASAQVALRSEAERVMAQCEQMRGRDVPA